MKIQLFILGMLILAFTACKEMDKGIEQGVKGTVIWYEGNLMPSINSSGSKSGKPIEREVVFCKPVKMNDLTKSGSFFTGLDSYITHKTTSDSKGMFAIKLPAGKYSVFTKEDDGYYANSFDGQGFIQVIEVKQNEVTNLPLKVDYKAVY